MAEHESHLHPLLLKLIGSAEDRAGILVQNLKRGDVLCIETMVDGVYAFEIIRPEERLVKVLRGDNYFFEGLDTWILGCSLTGTGTMVKLGWISIGYCCDIGNCLLSEIQRVSVNGIQVLPLNDFPKC